MKKIAKTIIAIVLLFTLFFTVNSCQEDVIPVLDTPEAELFDAPDKKLETDPDDKDEGVIPRL